MSVSRAKQKMGARPPSLRDSPEVFVQGKAGRALRSADLEILAGLICPGCKEGLSWPNANG